jgi:hypothetical protein
MRSGHCRFPPGCLQWPAPKIPGEARTNSRGVADLAVLSAVVVAPCPGADVSRIFQSWLVKLLVGVTGGSRLSGFLIG